MLRIRLRWLFQTVARDTKKTMYACMHACMHAGPVSIVPSIAIIAAVSFSARLICMYTDYFTAMAQTR